MAGQAIEGDQAFVVVEVPPERVWATVSDVVRTPEWSPVCRRVEWVPPWDAPTPGARFVGHNRRNGFRWSRECEITSAEPGREFAFRTFFRGQESTRWRYTFEPTSGGTRVVERYETVLIPRWIRFLRLLPGALRTTRRQAHDNISQSLENLKARVEGESGVRG